MSAWTRIAWTTAAIGAVAFFVTTTQELAAAYGYSADLGRPIVGRYYLPWMGLIWLANAHAYCVVVAWLHHASCPQASIAFLTQTDLRASGRIGGLLVVTGMFAFVGAWRSHTEGKRVRRVSVGAGEPLPLYLDLGVATGKMFALGHSAGLRAGELVRLVGDACARGFFVFGGIGAGKTTRLISRLAKQMLEQGAGVLTLDVKGDYGKTFCELAHRAGRAVDTIGIGGRRCNLIAGLMPERAATFVVRALEAAGNVGSDATFWNENAYALSRNVLGVLSFVDNQYTLAHLRRFIFSKPYATRVMEDVDRVYERLSIVALNGGPDAVAAERERDRLRRYADWVVDVWGDYAEKTKQNIKAQISQVVGLFDHPDMEAAFCAVDGESVPFESLLDGAAFVIDVPIALYGDSARTAYTFLVQRFFAMMEQRRLEPAWNQTRYVAFLCDEYQELVEPSHGRFFALGRDTKCVGVVSAQGVSSLEDKLKNAASVKNILQNFRQQIAFLTEDAATLDHFCKVFGNVDVERESRSRSASTSARGGGSRSRSVSVQEQRRGVIDPQVIRNLEDGEAVARLVIGNAAHDDVVRMDQLIVNGRAAVAS